MLTFMLHITVKPGHEDEALSTLSEIEETAHKDKGCINFVWLQHDDAPYSFTLFEQWESQAHLDAHLARSPDRWNAFVPALYGTPRSEKFRTVREMAAPLTDEQIKAFARNWFDKLSLHAAVDQLLPLLADTDLEMQFPEDTLRSKVDFSQWYVEVGKSYSNQEHLLEEVTVRNRMGDGKVLVEITVVWRARKTSDGSRLAFRAKQSWTLARSFSTGEPIIIKYEVKSLVPLNNSSLSLFFSHVALTCKDPIATEIFYTKHFGFRRARVSKIPGDQIVFIKTEDGAFRFELFKAAEASPLAPPEKDGYTFPSERHLAFQVTDVDAKLAEIGHDAPVTLGPLQFDEYIPGWRSVWIADPDGRIVEISQGYVDESDPPPLA